MLENETKKTYDVTKKAFPIAMTPISKQEIIEKLPDISVKTVELVLSKMLKDNKITKLGTFKDARYMRKM